MRQCFKMFNLAPHFMFCNYVLEFMLIIKLHERWKQESLCKTHTFSARLTVKLFLMSVVVLNSTDLKTTQLFGVEALEKMDVV